MNIAKKDMALLARQLGLVYRGTSRAGTLKYFDPVISSFDPENPALVSTSPGKSSTKEGKSVFYLVYPNGNVRREVIIGEKKKNNYPLNPVHTLGNERIYVSASPLEQVAILFRSVLNYRSHD